MTRTTRTRRSRRQAWVATGAAAALVATGALAAAPAHAATGTSATALTLALDGDLDLGPISAALVSADSTVGHVAAPAGEGTNRRSVGTLTTQGTAADGQVSVGALTATRTDIGTRSSAQLAGADVDLLGAGLVTTGDVEASAVCPVGGTPAVQASVAGLRVLGDAVSASAGPVTVSAPVSLGITGVADARVVATVSSPREVGSNGASVTAVRVSARVVADVLGLGGSDTVTVDLGHVDIATAQCLTPAAVDPSAATISPDSGPSSGGQTVTITGDAFVPGNTSVSFGDTTVPASRVDVAADGESLSLSTPPHEAGGVEVVVRTPGGSAGPLDYTYVGGSGNGPGDGPGDGPGGGDDGDATDNGGGGGAAADGNGLSGSAAIDPASAITGSANPGGLSGLLASTGPLGLVGLALLGLVMVLSGAMLAARAARRPGFAENPWIAHEPPAS